ncbi:hypothetical protein QCM80_22900 [Bradyrhizobium sp. SSUT112]|uniref:hypothetical protein n=1 Tax=Bradyrhizobium sp. SSUT112 TaxID=3040604 RepID=UPI0024491CB9|nr:hypothetical protein [Bradyrhizobium sp. SSUT112]MDH2353486.1 hypothetical protein [Bradyrhizobium sp. SSUT112]
MSEIVQFPQGYPRAQVDEVQAKAFRGLETEVCGLDRMGEITEHLVADWCQDVTNERSLELANFAVQHLADMLRAFKKNYFAAWRGETGSG